jgi:hypothetical protein
MKRVRAFGRFWWDFVVGDDSRVAAGLAAGLGLTSLLEHRDVSAWWLLPVVVAVVLAESVRRESRHIAEEMERPETHWFRRLKEIHARRQSFEQSSNDQRPTRK